MTYDELTKQLIAAGFELVPKDDRLFDVFPKETREWGIELWEKWGEETVEIVRIREPFKEENVQQFSISKAKLEDALLQNKCLTLS